MAACDARLAGCARRPVSRRWAVSSQAGTDLRPLGSSRTSSPGRTPAKPSGKIGVDARGPDLVDRPVLGHDVAQFVLGDRVGRALGHPGLVEHQHEVGRARRGGPHDRLLVALAQFHRHRVEQRRVDDRVEPAVVAAEITDVGDLEGGVVQAALGGLGAGQLDGRRRLVQARPW